MTTPETSQNEKTIGRNEPCPCGSGKKHKRCCGVNAAPKLGVPAETQQGGAPQMSKMPQLPAGFDPSAINPETMMPLIQAMQRLPRGQLQRLQAVMQKAMAGKDVSREAAELERSLPAEFKQFVQNFQLPAAPGGAPAAAGEAEALAAGMTAPAMTAEEARKIVEQAASEGKISKEQAGELLAGATPESSDSKKGFGGLLKKMGLGNKS